MHDDLQAWWQAGDRSALRRVMTRLVSELGREGAAGTSETDKIVAMLVSIPRIADAGVSTWALEHAAGIGAAISAPGGAAAGVLSTIASIHATRQFRSRPRRHTVARVVEYCTASRPA